MATGSRTTDRQAEKWRAEVASVRATIESIGIAIIMAFLLRAFLIEAFVIPTGSMAPRLMGEHFDLICPHCGWEYDHGYLMHPSFDRGQQTAPGEAICPNCDQRYPTTEAHRTYVNGGDRVLVIKYLYNFSEPKPWDVVVFRNPQNNRENFIKRLTGLPGETIEIVRGDIWVTPRGRDEWEIRRKPDDVQDVIWHVIYDNDYPLAEPAQYPSRKRWVANRDGNWDLQAQQGRLFHYGGPTPGSLTFEAPDGAFLPTYGYNTAEQNRQGIRTSGNRDICTDLKLSCVFIPTSPDSRIAMVFDVAWKRPPSDPNPGATPLVQRLAADISADGTVRLWQRAAGDNPSDAWPSGEQWTLWQEAQLAPLTPGSSYRLALTNVDYRLTLWVDGEAVLASTDADYVPSYDAAKWLHLAADALPAPKVSILTDGGPCDLRHLRLDRDVYYTTRVTRDDPSGPAGAYARSDPEYTNDPNEWIRRPAWGVTGGAIHLHDDEDDDLDSFFVLGDNSPQSFDSRRWTKAAPTLRLYGDDGQERIYQLGTVPRYNLIGKAMFVYWPAGYRLPFLPNLPILPNVGKMRRIQ